MKEEASNQNHTKLSMYHTECHRMCVHIDLDHLQSSKKIINTVATTTQINKPVKLTFNCMYVY